MLGPHTCVRTHKLLHTQHTHACALSHLAAAFVAAACGRAAEGPHAPTAAPAAALAALPGAQQGAARNKRGLQEK